MKEAAGEANLTVVTIILIAVIVAVATPLINSLMKGSGKKTCCTDNGGKWENGGCVQPFQLENPTGFSEEAYNECVNNLG